MTSQYQRDRLLFQKYNEETRVTFGELFKKLRIRTKMTLRQFCKKNEFDPGNISKLERGILLAPHDEKKLKSYAKALKIRPSDKEYMEFFDLAAGSNKNFPIKNIKDQNLLNKLPVLFRTLDRKDLTEEKLEKIIQIIRNESIG